MHAIFERKIPERDLPKEGLVEFDLQDFAEWYQGLRFHDFLKKQRKVQWHVKVVFFFSQYQGKDFFLDSGCV